MDTTPKFDAERATNAYLNQVSGAARAKSDAYFEGGYGLLLVDLIWALAIAGALMFTRFSNEMRAWVAERTRSRAGQTVLYAGLYAVIVGAAGFPLDWYEGFYRDHAYGLSSQSFVSWLGDWAIGSSVGLVQALIAIPLLYWAIRKAGHSWWVWGTGIMVALLVLTSTVFPVFIAPLTNHYTPLPDSALKQDILSLARANDIPADNVWQFDASKQSNRISANVSGFLGTTRISLNDNLLKQGTHDEILAVLGHEMGHYVMNHMLLLILLQGLIYAGGFFFIDRAFAAPSPDLFGGLWNVRRIDDVAGLPLLAALLSIYFFVMTPVSNSITRMAENQADIFGVDAVRKPDAFATVALKLSTYRKLDPGKWEEIIFYDHPSGRTRIETMMRWKKEHIRDADIRDTRFAAVVIAAVASPAPDRAVPSPPPGSSRASSVSQAARASSVQPAVSEAASCAWLLRITPSSSTLRPLSRSVAPVVVMSTITSAVPTAGAPSVAPALGTMR